MGSNFKRQKEMRRYYWARWTALAGATVVPILVATSVQSSGFLRAATSVLGIVISLVVAMTTAYLQVTRVGQRWRLNRSLLAALEAEAWRAVSGRGRYAVESLEQKFQVFVDNTERHIEDWETQYLALIADVEDLGGPGDETQQPK